MGINYYKRDARDTKFVLFEQLDLNKLLSYEAYKDFSAEDLNMVIDEGLKVAKEVFGPANQDGDRIGCRYEGGKVTTPDSFKACWRIMAENGWMAMSANPEFGGQGLPATVGSLVLEFFCGANMALTTYPGLTAGAARVIENFGTDEDRALFVEKMYTGVWGGTMCLTEPDAGSDVGWLRSKAVPEPGAGDPRLYKIEGAKRFITSGDHDLTENIVHLVLARIEGARSGTKGISLFIVPKIWVNQDGSLGEPNDVFCAGIEHKMGIHGSSTCSMNFGENGRCRGILLGEPHSGMAKMFQLMNEARLGCGVQALGLAAAAYDMARAYAKERVQGPPFTVRHAERVPIIQHEDVRRMLMNLKSGTEGLRGFLAKLVYYLDVAHRDPDEVARQKAYLQADLLLPVLKAYSSDYGYELVRDAIQVLAGVGFCSEFPVEQYARDIKIVSIWEGTSYIQSLDLVGRKLGLEGGQVFQAWLQEIMDFTGRHKDDADLSADVKRLFKAAQAVGDLAMRYLKYFQEGRLQLIPLSSTRFLECMAEVSIAHVLLEQARIAREKLAGVDAHSADGLFYRGKIETAKYFCRNTLPRVFARHMSLETEDTSALDIPEEAFI
ncbi:MAG: acyl-CoA dehydrogenase [Thermodesulfobacteriota bacterium]